MIAYTMTRDIYPRTTIPVSIIINVFDILLSNSSSQINTSIPTRQRYPIVTHRIEQIVCRLE